MSAGHKEIESPVGKVGSGAQALPKQAKRSAGSDPNRLEPQRDTVSDGNCSVAATSSYLLTRWWRLLSSDRPSHPMPAEASPPPSASAGLLSMFSRRSTEHVSDLFVRQLYTSGNKRICNLCNLCSLHRFSTQARSVFLHVYMWNGTQAATCDAFGAICGTMGTQAEGGFSWKRCPCRTKITSKP